MKDKKKENETQRVERGGEKKIICPGTPENDSVGIKIV